MPALAAKEHRITVPAASREVTLSLADLTPSEKNVVEFGGNTDLYLRLAAQDATAPVSLDFRIPPQAQVRIFCLLEGGAPVLLSDFDLAAASRLDFFSHITGASARMDISATIAHRAEAHFTGLTEASGTHKTAVAVHVHHTAGENLTWQKFYSYAADESAVAFTGRITVDAGAGGAVAHQLHRGVLLSEGARIDAQPFLNIMHDDVKCTHGSTVGFIDEDALRYLRARGISSAAAEEILILSSQRQFYNALPHERASGFFGYREDFSP